MLEAVTIDLVQIQSCRSEGGLVDQVLQVGSGEANGTGGYFFQVDISVEGDFPDMDFQNSLAGLLVGPVQRYLTVKAPGAEQGTVEHVGAVGGGQNNHIFVTFETVHFCEDLVECLLPFIVTSTEAGATGAPDGIQFINKNQRRCFLAGGVEHIPNSCRANANEHFYELGGTDAEKGYLCLPCNGLGQQGLAGARRTNQQDARWHFRTQGLVFFRGRQEINDFGDVPLGGLDARNV